jgi:hypothetical protein
MTTQLNHPGGDAGVERDEISGRLLETFVVSIIGSTSSKRLDTPEMVILNLREPHERTGHEDGLLLFHRSTLGTCRACLII